MKKLNWMMCVAGIALSSHAFSACSETQLCVRLKFEGEAGSQAQLQPMIPFAKGKIAVMEPNTEVEVELEDDTPSHITPIDGVGSITKNGNKYECSLPSEIPIQKGKFPVLTYQLADQCKVELTKP